MNLLLGDYWKISFFKASSVQDSLTFSAFVGLHKFHYVLFYILSKCSARRECWHGISTRSHPGKNVQAVILAQRVCREWDWITQPFVIRVVLSGEGYEKLKGMKDTGGNSSVLQVAFTKHVLIYIFWKSWALIYLLCSCIPVWVLWDRYNYFKYVAFFSFNLVIQYSLEVVSFALRVLKFYLSKVL